MSAPAPPRLALAASTHVRISHAQIGELPATVEACEEGTLALVLAVPDSRIRRLHGAEVGVEVMSARGIQRLLGVLELRGDGADRLIVRLLGRSERIQRRGWARVDVVVPVSVHGIDEALGGETTTLNVSGGGMLIRDRWRLPLGLDVRFELEVEPDEPRLKGLGRVVREAAADQKGITIADLSREDEERLVRFVRRREVLALRTKGNR